MRNLVFYKDTIGKIIENVSPLDDYLVLLFTDNTFCVLNAVYIDEDIEEQFIDIQDAFFHIEGFTSKIKRKGYDKLNSVEIVRLGILTQEEVNLLLEKAEKEEQDIINKHKDNTRKQRYDEYLKLKEEFDPKPEF